MQHYPKHYCGVFGIYGQPNAAELTYYGLYALQHRGQESAGIVTCDGRQFRKHLGMGLVSQIFDSDKLHALVGGMAIATVIGVIIGVLAGFYGGWTDMLLSRVIDVVLSIPFLLLGLGIGAAC